jgi:hypothetical protein
MLAKPLPAGVTVGAVSVAGVALETRIDVQAFPLQGC